MACTEYMFPRFSDALLREFGDCMDRRRKSLKHQGVSIEYNTDPYAECEWVNILVWRTSCPHILLELSEGGCISVFVRSDARANRGKILFRLENARAIPNGKEVYRAFEESIHHVAFIDQSKLNERVMGALETTWKQVTVRMEA